MFGRMSGHLAAGLALITLAACGGAIAPGEEGERGIPAGVSTAATLSSDCTGVVPATTGAAYDARVELGDVGACLAAETAADGRAVAGVQYNGTWDTWNLVSATGWSGSFGVRSEATPSTTTSPNLFPQAQGFETLESSTTLGSDRLFHRRVAVRAINDAGATSGTTSLINLASASATGFPDRLWTVAGDRAHGGVFVSHMSEPGDGTWHVYAQRFDARAAARAAPSQLATGLTSASPPLAMASAVATTGLGLTLWDNGSAIRASWSDAQGRPLGGTFGLPGRFSASTPVFLAPLLDGSVALQISGKWIAAVPSGQQTSTAVPSWLSTRPNTHVSIVRGGRAYAAFFDPAFGACTSEHVALFAPSGARCGAIDLAPASGAGCAVTGEVGPDGTVTIQGPEQEDPMASAPSFHCTQRYYTGLLR